MPAWLISSLRPGLISKRRGAEMPPDKPISMDDFCTVEAAELCDVDVRIWLDLDEDRFRVSSTNGGCPSLEDSLDGITIDLLKAYPHDGHLHILLGGHYGTGAEDDARVDIILSYHGRYLLIGHAEDML